MSANISSFCPGCKCHWEDCVCVRELKPINLSIDALDPSKFILRSVMNTINKPALFALSVVAIGLFGIGLQLGIHHGRELERGLKVTSKPYVILFQSVESLDYERCSKDDNCMDVMTTDVLPKRSDLEPEGSDSYNCELHNDCGEDFMSDNKQVVER